VNDTKSPTLLAPSKSAAAPKPKRGGRWLAGCGCGLVLLLIGLAVAAVFAAEPIAASMLEDEVAAQGAVCESLDVSVHLLEARAEVAPLDCTFADGPIARLKTRTSLDIELDGLTPTRIEASEVTIDLRERTTPARDNGWLEQVAGLQEARQEVEALMMDGAALSKRDLPDIAIDTLVITRAQRPLGEMTDVDFHGDTGSYVITSDTLDFEQEASNVRSIRATLTPDRADATARVTASVRVFIVSVSQEVVVRILGTNLEHGPPNFEVTVDSAGTR
jgi:hypothetical protein